MKQDNKVLFMGIIVSAVFTYLIWVFGHTFLDVVLGEDTGYLHYYWKLPTRMFWPLFTAWAFYLAHQFLTFWIVYKAKKDKRAYSNQLTKWNWAMLGTHAFFMVAHLVHTHVWYDSLAQDTPIWLSQASVIVMLVLIFILVNNKRGLFFGKKFPIPAVVNRWVADYHSYIFLFAIVFTFWYHPMEFTQGHLIGFFYMFLLMIQSSTMYTKVHLNLAWILVLEVLVLAHGTLVAIGQQNEMWPMFAFGFGFIFVVTQIYSLKLQKHWNLLIQAGYLIAVALVYVGGYGSNKTVTDLNEIIRIPAIEYGLVFAFIAAIWLPFGVKKLVSKK